MHLFSFGKLICDLFLLFFFLGIVFRNGKREERWEREDAHSVSSCSVMVTR